MIFHVLAITFNTKPGFWNYEMTTCYNAVFYLFCCFFLFYSAEIMLQEIMTLQIHQHHDKYRHLLLYWNCTHKTIDGVLCRQYLKEKKISLHLLFLVDTNLNYFFIFLFFLVHPDGDLTAYFIASKCFAAKTGFLSRWLDVAHSGFSKCAFSFKFGRYRVPHLLDFQWYIYDIYI